MTEHTSRRVLWALLIVFAGLAIRYGLAIPPFEQPDESSHLIALRWYAVERTLPPLNPPVETLNSGAAIEDYLSYNDPPYYYAPPLYYSVGGLLTAWADFTDLPALLIPSPRWAAGYALIPGTDATDKTTYTHHPTLEAPASSGTMQALYIMRLFGVACGLIVIVMTYQTARVLLPKNPGIWAGAAAIAALHPQVIANAPAVSNDPLTYALFATFLWLSVRLIRQGGGTQRTAVLGLIAGLAVLSKQSALMLLPLGGAAVILSEWHGPLKDLNPGRLIGLGLVFGTVAALVGGWWYGWNWLQYNDPLGLSAHLGVQPGLPGPFGWAEATSILKTWLATFGWTVIEVPEAAYIAGGVIGIAALAGILYALIPGTVPARLDPATRRGLILLALLLIMMAASLVKWTVDTGSAYGRLLLPAEPAIAVLMAWGLASWGRGKPIQVGYVVIGLAALTWAVAIPPLVLEPAFETPLVTELPAGVDPVDIRFANGVRLVAAEVPGDDLQPGDSLDVTLYWQADAPNGARYRTFIQLGPWNAYPPLVEIDTWAGSAMMPTDRWRRGDMISQRVTLTAPAWTAAPALYWVRVGMIDEAGNRVAVTNSRDVITLGPWDPTTGQVAVLGPNRVLSVGEPRGECPIYREIGDGLTLHSYDIERAATDEGIRISLTVVWETGETYERNLGFDVALRGPNGLVIGEETTAPNAGEYPTSVWLAGQRVSQRYDFLLAGPITEEITVEMTVEDFAPFMVTRLRMEADGLPDDVFCPQD